MSTTATICFIARDELHRQERPYLHTYSAKGIKRTNLSFEAIDDIEIQDIRQFPLTFKEKGMEMVKLKTSLTYGDFDDKEKVEKVFLREARDTIRDLIEIEDVFVYEYRIRRRPSSFPYQAGQVIDPNAFVPVLGVHVDYSADDTVDRIEQAFGNRAPDMLSRPYYFLNLWLPLRGPVRDLPLAICDPETVDLKDDTTTVQAINIDSVGELLNVYHNPRQKWYYVSDQMPTEALIFKEYDSTRPDIVGVPHAAFVQDTTVPLEKSRESIEVRAMVFLDKK